MPLPLIPIFAWGLGALALAGIAAAAFGAFDKKTQNKRVAILGSRNVGKTHFIHFITYKDVPDFVPPSTSVEGRPETVYVRGTPWTVVDLPGVKDFRQNWMEQYKQSDVTLFFIDASRIADGDQTHIDEVLSSSKQIGLWNEEMVHATPTKLKPKIVIVANLADKSAKVKGYEGNYVLTLDYFCGLPAIKTLIHNTKSSSKDVSLVLGSLKTKESAVKLLEHLEKVL